MAREALENTRNNIHWTKIPSRGNENTQSYFIYEKHLEKVVFQLPSISVTVKAKA